MTEKAQNLTSVQLLFLSGYTMGMIMQIFSPNFIGTLTLDKSAWLPNSAFASQWFNFDRSAKKALLLFMTRTSRPFVLKAGIFFQLNLNTFLRVRTKGVLSLFPCNTTCPLFYFTDNENSLLLPRRFTKLRVINQFG